MTSIAGFILTMNLMLGILSCALSIILVLYGFLFRNPDRTTNKHYKGGFHIIAHMDGYISSINNAFIDDVEYYAIEITGDIFSTNTNFFPISGTISQIESANIKILGQKNKQYFKESRSYTVITDHDDEVIFTKDAGDQGQIVSSLQEFVGAKLSTGERFGFMKSTNTGKIYAPVRRFLVKITPGDRTVGGLTVIALRI